MLHFHNFIMIFPLFLGVEMTMFEVLFETFFFFIYSSLIQYIPTTAFLPSTLPSLPYLPKAEEFPLGSFLLRSFLLFINPPSYGFSCSIFILQSLFKHGLSNPHFLIFLHFEYGDFWTPSCLLKESVHLTVVTKIWWITFFALHLYHPHFYYRVYVSRSICFIIYAR